MEDSASERVRLRWSIKIPMRDGVHLSASLYLPKERATGAPTLFALTPYTAHRNHLRASYFAAHGFVFLNVDARGRGNSDGTFRPFIQEAKDGHDIVEWIAQQPFCNGKVGMYSGSYEGYVQWATAKEFPAHLMTIAPAMAAAPGVDMAMRNNIPFPYVMQWLTLVSGRTSQQRIFEDQAFWRAHFRELHQSGRPFRDLDALVGNPSPIFQEWLSHPSLDAYWDAFKPSVEECAKIDLPILTLTGCYDVDQPGALYHYRQHMLHASPAAAQKHFLVIGPWDHLGTLAPKQDCAGLKFGPQAVVDVMQLHLQWYNWTLCSGPRPEFLKARVAYYVMGAEHWRYADTLQAVTARSVAYYLRSNGNPTDVLNPGSLSTESPSGREPDHYVYDPRDVMLAQLESTVDPESRVDHRMVHAAAGRQLVYHSMLFETDTEITGFFRFCAWLAIDQPDTDFQVSVYEICLDGTAIHLTGDTIRARYREGLREQKLISTGEPLCYEFERFTFISRMIRRGHCLRLVVGPINSIYSQKNYNSGGVVAEESMEQARPVTVKLFHDSSRPSALYVPLGRADD
jgi:putative CocE/NonD family hydrolase